MKKLTILLSFLLIASTLAAQENEMDQNDQMDMGQNDYGNYNHWSIEVHGGLNKPSRPFAEGYYAPTFIPTDNGDWGYHADLGVRYMFNTKFGLKINAGYDQFKPNSGSKDFDTKYYHATLEGVVNMGAVLGFREWTQRVNFLVHGGFGPGHIQISDDNLVKYNDHGDNLYVFTVGFTPQIRLTDWWALNLDLSIFGNVNQDFTTDGTMKTSDFDNNVARGFNGMNVDASIGFNFYLGGADKHADWYNETKHGAMQNKLDSLQNRVAKIENDMKDSDQDGIPDYLDREPNTMNGVAVDSKGRAIDKNNNGVPDEIESALDQRYQRKEGAQETQTGVIRKLLNDGYVNVYFKFNSTQPEDHSLKAVNYLIHYMKENPSTNAELVGYADELGLPEYNKQLSLKRAQRVKAILIASGIDESRLSVTGNGEDDSVDKSSSDARKIVRRVTFKLK